MFISLYSDLKKPKEESKKILEELYLQKAKFDLILRKKNGLSEKILTSMKMMLLMVEEFTVDYKINKDKKIHCWIITIQIKKNL